jgi:hypothetical protein
MTEVDPMSVNSASSGYRDPSVGGAPGARPPGHLAGRGSAPPRSPLDWARQRLGGRGTRRLSAAGQRATHQLEHLGPSWLVVDWPETVLAGIDQDQAGFLAIGPGGVYSVTVVDHGRQRVMLAGDVVQIHGRRPPYVARARRTARMVSQALSAAVGTNVPVVPVLTFVGSGAISAQGLPTGCLAVAHRELDRLLLAAGYKISADTAQKLAEVARHPSTWADRYRWYPDHQTASDNRTARR